MYIVWFLDLPRSRDKPFPGGSETSEWMPSPKPNHPPPPNPLTARMFSFQFIFRKVYRGPKVKRKTVGKGERAIENEPRGRKNRLREGRKTGEGEGQTFNMAVNTERDNSSTRGFLRSPKESAKKKTISDCID